MSQVPLPRNLRRSLRRNRLARTMRSAVLSGIDTIEHTLSAANHLGPPRRLRGVGAGDFHEVGSRLVDQLVDVGGMRTHHQVLDIGCGSGRLALPLTRFLTEGRYEGFDVDAEMVAWCKGSITPRFPSFGFRVIDIANTHYNPAGDQTAANIRFPYEDAEFDIAVATSLFTHLLPASVENYVHETARVLAPGGRLFGTFCLLDGHVTHRVDRGVAQIDLRHVQRDADTGAEFRVLDPRCPETAVGLPRDFVVRTLHEAGLGVTAVHAGTWSGDLGGMSFQDVVIASSGPARIRAAA